MRQHVTMSRESSILGLPVAFVVGLLVLGATLLVTSIRGVFTVDEANYLVTVLGVRAGSSHVPNTAGLSPSRELLFFDPGPWTRVVARAPVASVAPPLYAAMALPFSYAGWRGLVALNVLAYLAVVTVVFVYARGHAAKAFTPWLAAGAVGLGAYLPEYAQGLWPHMLSVALCTGGIYAASRSLDSGRVAAAAMAGLLLGLATGVRYQNAALIAAAGFGLFIECMSHLRRPRVRASKIGRADGRSSELGDARRHMQALAAFVAATALPLAASAAINHSRFESWNPISKGSGYLHVPLPSTGPSLFDPLVMFWGLVIDFTVRPLLHGPDVETWWRYDAVTHTHLMYGLIEKKALVQSAPWALLGMCALSVSLRPSGTRINGRQKHLRFLCLIVGAVFTTFAFAGVTRHDGLAFNQRYLLEAVPFLAVAFAWAVETRAFQPRLFVWGGSAGAVLALAPLLLTPVEGTAAASFWIFRHLGVMKLPLLLGALLVAAWSASMRWPRLRGSVALLAGMCVAWGCALHAVTDLQASRYVRGVNEARADALARVLPDHSAVVTHWGYKEGAVPLLLDRDLVILNAHADEAAATPRHVEELLRAGRRVFVVADGFPADMLERVVSGRAAQPIAEAPLRVLELR